MSIASKQSFLFDVERRLNTILPVDSMNSVMRVLSEQIGYYDIERSQNDTNDTESEELLSAFINAKRVEGRSPNTIARYEYIIKRTHKAINVPTRSISVFHLRKYFADEKARGVSDSTLDGSRQVLSAYFGWLQKEGLISNNPTVNIGAIKSQKKIRKPFSAVDIERLKESCTSDRDKAIIALLLSTGCRISEVCMLDRDSVDFDNMEVLVLGKGNKERTVFIDDITAMLLRRYTESRRDESVSLFVGKGTKRLLPGGVRIMLKRLESRSGVDNVHPHRFRRTLATNLIDRGMSIQEVATILGHEKLDTTMRYVYVNNTNVKNSYMRNI